MKEILKDLNKAFENRVRLGIMSSLMVNDVQSFQDLKRVLGVTDGNLASHLKALEKVEFITYTKSFVDRKPLTSYSATKLGKLAFKKHLGAIERLLKT